MKQKLYIILTGLFLLSLNVNAQAPNAFNYQGVARDGSGNILSEQPIGLEFTIHQTTATGTVVYQETQTTTTDQFGLFSVAIGEGTVVSGSFATIGWGSNGEYLQVGLDPTGGTNYTDMGTTQFLSVPYALYAASSGNGATVTGTDPIFVTGSNIISISGNEGGILYGTGAGTSALFTPAGTAGQVLSSNGTGAPTWITLSGSGTGDNWGSQVAITDSNETGAVENTITGDGIISSPLKLAQQGATIGQVLAWNGVTWKPTTNSGSSANAWNLTGNSGTIAGTNFVGTTDANDLVFKANGGEAMRISNSTLSVGIGTINPTQKLDVAGSIKFSGALMPGNLAGTAGNILLSGGAGVPPTWLANGTDGEILTLSGGVPTWATASGGGTVIATSPLSISGTDLSLIGTYGGVVYGTGTGSAFTPAGTSGEVLVAQGPGNAPIWSSIGTVAGTSNIVPGVGSSVVVTNGANQCVGSSNVSVDVQGAAGGIFYGTGSGTSAQFTSTGTAGQVLSSNGTGAPTWITLSGSGTGDNWGTQYVITNATLTGEGLSSSPLGIAQQGATTGQALLWNGTAWAPGTVTGSGVSNITATPPLYITGSTTPNISIQGTGSGGILYSTGTGTSAIFTPAGAAGQVLQSNGTGAPTWVTLPGSTGDNWGTQVAITDSNETGAIENTITGDGLPTSPLKLAQQGATTGQVLEWNGATWKPATSSGSGWSLTGNSGTTAGTDFVGTTDNTDFVIKTNGTEKVRITKGGNVGVGTNAPAADAGVALKSWHLETQAGTSAPTISINTANIGTGGNSVFNATNGAVGATDVGGSIQITTGTASVNAGQILTVKYGTAYTTAPSVVITPTDATTATSNIAAYVTSSTTGFTINFGNSPALSTSYNFNYFVIETQ